MKPKPSRTAIEQAEALLDLAQRIRDGNLWTPEQRRDARILVSLLSEHSLAADRRAA